MSNEKHQNDGTVKKRYEELSRRREPFLDRARDAAKLTIPSLLPPDAHTGTSSLPTPHQSVGARGLNNLASKLLLALFPPNSPFYKFGVDPSLLEQLSEVDENVRAQVEETLGKIERMIMRKFESERIRTTAFQALLQVIMAGNALLYFPPDSKGARMFRLDHFVVRRDSMGNVLEIISWERVSPKHLSKEYTELLQSVPEHSDPDPEAELDLYTYIQFKDGMWHVHQELNGFMVPSSEGTFPKDALPWLPLTFTRIDGEDYGRGYVEQYLGDLIETEGLSKAIGDATAAMAKVVILVRPGGSTDPDDLIEAGNLDVVEGREEDVSTVSLANKSYDLSVAERRLNTLEQRLAYAFLLHTAIQRDAERVTAEEIRYMAQELEDALGGVYSVQSVEFQLPLVVLLKTRMEKAGELPELPAEADLDISITTGIEALGRGHDLNKLESFLAGALRTAPPEVVAQFINWPDYFKRRATAIGLDTEGLVKSQQQIEAEQQQAQQMAMMQQFGPEVLKQGGGLLQKATERTNEPPVG